MLASDKAIESHGSVDKKNREVILTVPRELSPFVPGIRSHLYQSPAGEERTLGSEEREM